MLEKIIRQCALSFAISACSPSEKTCQSDADCQINYLCENNVCLDSRSKTESVGEMNISSGRTNTEGIIHLNYPHNQVRLKVVNSAGQPLSRAAVTFFWNSDVQLIHARYEDNQDLQFISDNTEMTMEVIPKSWHGYTDRDSRNSFIAWAKSNWVNYGCFRNDVPSLAKANIFDALDYVDIQRIITLVKSESAVVSTLQQLGAISEGCPAYRLLVYDREFVTGPIGLVQCLNSKQAILTHYCPQSRDGGY